MIYTYINIEWKISLVKILITKKNLYNLIIILVVCVNNIISIIVERYYSEQLKMEL